MSNACGTLHSKCTLTSSEQPPSETGSWPPCLRADSQPPSALPPTTRGGEEPGKPEFDSIQQNMLQALRHCEAQMQLLCTAGGEHLGLASCDRVMLVYTGSLNAKRVNDLFRATHEIELGCHANTGARCLLWTVYSRLITRLLSGPYPTRTLAVHKCKKLLGSCIRSCR